MERQRPSTAGARPPPGAVLSGGGGLSRVASVEGSSKMMREGDDANYSPVAAQRHSSSAFGSMSTTAPPPAAAAAVAANNHQMSTTSLNALSETVQEDFRKRQQHSKQRFESASGAYLRLEQNLALESRRRGEGDSILEAKVEQVFGQVSSDLEATLTKRMDLINRNLGIVEAKVDEMSVSVVNDRSQTEQALQEIRDGNAQALAEVQDQLALERSERLDNEVIMLKNIKKEISRMHERFNIETQVREKMGTTVKDTLAKMKYSEDEEGMDRIKVNMLEEVASLQTALAIEIEARRKSEENYAHTMEALIRQVETGMQQLH